MEAKSGRLGGTKEEAQGGKNVGKHLGRADTKGEGQLAQEYIRRKAKISHRVLLSISPYRGEALLQFKRRLGVGATKVPHHRRTQTEARVAPGTPLKPSARPSPVVPISEAVLDEKAEDAKKVQIIEALDDLEARDEDKDKDRDREKDQEGGKGKEEQLKEDAIQAQMKQAEALIAKITQDRIEDDDFHTPRSLNDGYLSGEGPGSDPESEKELEVTVGDIQNGLAILVTKECYIVQWPVEMLPVGVSRGHKFSILIKRNENSEVLRENAICTHQNHLLSLISNDK